MRAIRTRLARERGTTIVEVLVAAVLTLVVMLFAAQGYLSNSRSQVRQQDWVQMLDNSDLTKTWVTSYLQAADVPLLGADATSLRFSANGRCYRLALDTGAQTLSAQTDTLLSDPGCSLVANAAPDIISRWVINDPNASDPLFVYKKADGTAFTPDSGTLGDVAEVVMKLHIGYPNEINALPIQRQYDIMIGGQFLAGAPPDNSVSTAKIIASNVTGAKIAPGAVTPDKLSVPARTSFMTVPIQSASQDTWPISTSWGDQGAPGNVFARAGLTLADYCLTATSNAKALDARGVFVVHNTDASHALSLVFRLQRYAADGSSHDTFQTMAIPGGPNVPAASYTTLTTDWTAVDCSAADIGTTYFYAAQEELTTASTVTSILVPATMIQLKYR